MKKFIIICLLLSLFGCQQVSNGTEVNDDTNDVIEVYETVGAAILSMEGSTLHCAPEDYDRDEYDRFVDSFYTAQLMDSTIYWEYYRHIVDNDGVQTVDEIDREITREDFEEMLEYGTVYGYLDLTQNKEVVKVTVWGELIIYE